MGLLLVALWFAFGLRLMYFLRMNRIVDDYISMLSVRAILERGVPALPSGLLYGPKGLVHSYVGALASLVFGSSEFALCFPSVLAGVVAVCYVYRVGRDWFGPAVGLSAAMALTWLPSAVEWGGRIRMYSLWQLLSLVAVHLLVNGYLNDDGRDRRVRVVGILMMLLAVFTHILALLALGGLIAGIATSRLFARGTLRRSLSPSFCEVLAGLIFVIAVAALDPIGGPWGGQGKMSDLAQGTLTVQSVQARALYLLAYTHEFVTPPLWPLTIFYAIGFIRLSLRLLRKSAISGDWIALSLYVLVLCTWSATSILAFIQRDRYLFGIIPFYLLLAVREFYSLAKTILTSVRWSFLVADDFVMAVVISLLVLALLAPSVFQLMDENTSDLAAAYLYVRDHWASGDVVAACHPAPSEWILGRTDYYAVEYGAEVHEGAGGEKFDNWTGAPLIDSPDEFAIILDGSARVWYAPDEICWEYYLGEEFRQFVRQNMQIVFDQSGMQVFVSRTD
jgi:hypothetical protein